MVPKPSLLAEYLSGNASYRSVASSLHLCAVKGLASWIEAYAGQREGDTDMEGACCPHCPDLRCGSRSSGSDSAQSGGSSISLNGMV